MTLLTNSGVGCCGPATVVEVTDAQVKPDPTTNVTVITGASRGIGAATARLLAKRMSGEQHHLVLTYATNVEAAQSVANQLSSFDIGISVIKADVASEADVLAVYSEVDRIGRITGLVNNAGILDTISPFVDLTVDRLERIWAVNITGVFLCAREAVKRMADGPTTGSIVNVSSRAASFGSPREYIDYAASKGAVDTMTVGLAAEVARQNIRVNAVRPGLIHTDIHASGGDANRVNRLADNVPMGRGGDADEVANLIAWLLSDEASYVTGALLDVGGGR